MSPDQTAQRWSILIWDHIVCNIHKISRYLPGETGEKMLITFAPAGASPTWAAVFEIRHYTILLRHKS